MVRKQFIATTVSVVLLSLVLSSCQLAPDQVSCRALPNAGGYNEVFSNPIGGWRAGDGAFTIPMPNNRLLWLFGDSRLDADGAFVRNALVAQEGNCFTHLGKGSPGSRQTPVESSAGNSWDWPVGGVFDSSSNSTYILSNRYVHPALGTGLWKFQVVGSDMTKVSTTTWDLQTTGATPGPQRADVNLSGVTQVGLQVFIYGRLSRSTDQFVARATTATFATGPWEYWDGSGWSKSFDKRAAMAFPGRAAGPRAMFSVVPVKGGYLGSAMDWDVVSTTGHAFFATNPQGPWTDLGTAFDLGKPCLTCISYLGMIRYLPGAGWVAMASQMDTSATLDDFSRYKPHFVQVTLPGVTTLQPLPFGQTPTQTSTTVPGSTEPPATAPATTSPPGTPPATSSPPGTRAPVMTIPSTVRHVGPPSSTAPPPRYGIVEKLLLRAASRTFQMPRTSG